MLVAGFQGVSSTGKNVTTLGRGGSDTSAVAVAAALGADVCEIYTDVSGRLHGRPADRARRAQARDASPSRRCSRWPPRGPGCCSCARSSTRATTACASTAAPPSTMSPVRLCCGRRDDGAAADHSSHAFDAEARVTLLGVPDAPGAAARIFAALAGANVNVDMIVQNEPVSAGGLARSPSRSRARTCAWRGPRSSPSRATRSASWERTRRWARCRSWAPGCAPTRASRRRCSACSQARA